MSENIVLEMTEEPIFVEDSTHHSLEEEPVLEEPAMAEPTMEEPEPIAVSEEEPVLEEPEPVLEESPVEEPEEPEPVLEPEEQEPLLEYVSHEVDVNVPDIYVEPSVPKNEIPDIVFIVPYRDRQTHYEFFSKHMEYILQDVPNARIYYIHQRDNRGFNRGAMKNIGFRMVRNKWPDHYKNMTLVFNDVDSMPKTPGLLNYATVPNVVKHFYGFRHTLGGIVSIRAADFERINGFPNFWAWGYEDNMLQHRVGQYNMTIDRSTFFAINDPRILRLSESSIRPVNRAEFDRYVNKTQEGISQINGLTYYIDESTGFVEVYRFFTQTQESVQSTVNYDLRHGPIPFKTFIPKRGAARMKMCIM
jgi:hypothetical protein